MTIPIGSSIAWCRGFTALALWAAGVSSALAQIPAGQAGFERNVRPFLEEHCFRCHGPEKAKAKLALHKIKGVGGSDEEMEKLKSHFSIPIESNSWRDGYSFKIYEEHQMKELASLDSRFQY